MPEGANHRRYRERHFKAPYGNGIRKQDARIVIPDDVVRREFDGPCFRCGVNGGCKHRPWEGEYV